MKKQSDNIIEKLIKTLQDQSTDVPKVLDLVSELAKSDPEKAGFSVDAGLIDKLGRELVARKETAVAELVKNAYDADAIEVKLIFDFTNIPGGTIRIIDNGLGMTREQFIDGFMRISSTEKVENPVSLKYNRQRAGRKGIGRFAAQRLGNKLTVISNHDSENKGIKATINWDDFKSGKELWSIRSNITEIEPSDQGTILIIEGVRDVWTENEIKNTYNYILDLIQPNPISKEEEKGLPEDPGFESVFTYSDQNGSKVIADKQSEIFQYAIAEIEGNVDENGFSNWKIKSDRLKLNDSYKLGLINNSESPLHFLRDINLKAYYFIYEKDLIPGTQRRTIQKLAQYKGGIKIYRNGFRVPPYGDPKNDWLKLDESVRRRAILAPHGNINFFGQIYISDIQGKYFDETSSREGLIENSAFDELFDWALKGIIHSVLMVSEKRGRKPKAGKTRDKSPADSLYIISNNLRKLSVHLRDKRADGIKDITKKEALNAIISTKNALTEFASLIEKTADLVKQELAEMETLRVLAGLGLVIAEFSHEIKVLSDSIVVDSKSIVENPYIDSEIRNIVQRFLSNFSLFKNYSGYFNTAIADNINRQLRPIAIQDVFNNFVDTVRTSAHKSGIEIDDPIFNSYYLFTIPMHPSEWASILYNLYTNSKKAIIRKKVKGRIQLQSGIVNSYIYVRFSDNGDGIPAENRDRIFNAFFTTTSINIPSAQTDENILGSGLGLKIVKDIIENYNGSIELVDPPEGFSTCFEIKIPAISKEERKRYES